MAELTNTRSKSKNTAYYIKSVIGLVIMIFFGYLPAPAPITQVGMHVLGQFIGLVFLWTFVDMVWPTFAGILMFGFVAQSVYPNSFAMHSMYEAGSQSIGHWVTVIVLNMLILCDVLNETGIIKRVALWFLTRKIAKKSPWGFTFMYLLAALVIGMLMDVTPAQVFMLALAKEIFSVLRVDKDDLWTRVITIGSTFTVVIMFAATPVCHTLAILFMGVYSAISGVSVNWISYMLVAIPVCVVMWLIMIAFLRFIVKPDMSKLENTDFSAISNMREKMGKMDKRERTVAVVSIVLVIVWLLPGFLSLLAPGSALAVWLDDITMLAPMLAAIVFLAIVHIEGKPILDIAKATKSVSFHIIFLLAGIMMISSAVGEAPTGISDWVHEFVAPIVSGMSPLLLIAFFTLAGVFLTNLCNNVPVGIILISVAVPVSLQMGLNPFIPVVAIAIAANMAFVIPPAMAPVGYCYADPFGGPKHTFRWGLVTALISVIVISLLAYPLGLLFG